MRYDQIFYMKKTQSSSEISPICLRINELVEKKFFSNNSAFARQVGLAEANIRAYISGTIPKADMLGKIADALDVSCDWLILGKENSQNNTIVKSDKTADYYENRIDRLLTIVEKQQDTINELSKKGTMTIAREDDNVGCVGA